MKEYKWPTKTCKEQAAELRKEQDKEPETEAPKQKGKGRQKKEEATEASE